jgi:hypothetical protein
MRDVLDILIALPVKPFFLFDTGTQKKLWSSMYIASKTWVVKRFTQIVVDSRFRVNWIPIAFKSSLGRLLNF